MAAVTAIEVKDGVVEWIEKNPEVAFAKAFIAGIVLLIALCAGIALCGPIGG